MSGDLSWFRDSLQRETSWHIATSSGEAASAGAIFEAGIIHANFYLTQSPETAVVAPGPGAGTYRNVTKLKFVGAGLGVGVGPLLVDISASDTAMPSGGRIFCGPTLRASDVTIDDLCGWCTLRTYAVSIGGGAGITLLFFGVGPQGFLPAATAIGRVFGTQIGIPGAAAMEYIGRIGR